MLKADERDQPGSCWNKANDDELVFVILERDVAAVATILDWCAHRIRLGKNTPDDPQISEAKTLAYKILDSQQS